MRTTGVHDGVDVSCRKVVFRFAWVVLALLLAAMPSLAQSTGTILGVVKDSSGGVVPQAKVTVLDTDTNQPRTVTTEDDGSFRFPALATGHYSVKIEKDGFKTQTQTGLTLEVTQELVVNPALELGTSTQEVTVTGEAPLVNTTNSSLGGLVSEDKMSDLPLNGRNYIDLSLLQPGISNASAVGQTNAAIGTWFSSNGAPPRSNNVTLDGTSVVNLQGGSTASVNGETLGVDGIKEYKVITTAFNAEYGMTMGSQVVIVSKGGSNRWSGDVFEYIRNSALDARNFFDGPQIPKFERNNFGGSFGGPIRKDKTFFYGVYEGVRQTLGVSGLVNVPPAACHTANNIVDKNCIPSLGAATLTVAPVIRTILAQYPIPQSGSTFTFPTTAPSVEDYGQIRVDHNLSNSDSLFGRYTIDNGTRDSATASLGASATGAFPQFRTFSENRNQFLTVSENHIFAPTVLNTARASYSRTNVYITPTYPNGPLIGPGLSLLPGQPLGQITVNGLSAFGVNNAPAHFVQNIYTVSDDLYLTKGRHAFKFGTLINRYNDGISTATSTYGALTFGNLQSFLLGQASSIAARTPGSVNDYDFIFNTIGFYAQDDWRVASRLTLNLGVRYEFMTTPYELRGNQYAIRNADTDSCCVLTPGPVMRNASFGNVSPRAGFAWDVFGNGKTSVRGAFGIYYDVGNIGSVLLQQSGAIPPLSSQSSATPAPGTVTTLPLTFTAAQFGKTIRTSDYNATQPHVLQYNLTVERQLPFKMSLSVSYVGSKGVHLWHPEEGNPEIPAAVVNGLPYFLGNVANYTNTSGWQSIKLVTTSGTSSYNSLQVVVNKQLGHSLEFQSAYTWGNLLDNVNGQQTGNDCTILGGDSGVYSPNMSLDKGPSCYDIVQNWHFNLLYHFPTIKSDRFAAKLVNGWWMGNIVSIQSGPPYTPELGTQRSKSGNLVNIVDHASIATAADAAACPVVNTTTCKYIPVPFDKSTVTTGNPLQWFNPAMFVISPITTTPGGSTICTLATCPAATFPGYSTLGNASRGLLWAPGLGTWNLSINKDTALPFLGEAGKLQFRAEIFNLLNRANFGIPNGTVFAGTATDYAPASELPSSTAGQILNTNGTSRQIQFALKVVF